MNTQLHLVESEQNTLLLMAGGHTVCVIDRAYTALAERIVACVNACTGLPTEALESGTVRMARVRGSE
jgi:hypothetical protein